MYQANYEEATIHFLVLVKKTSLPRVHVSTQKGERERERERKNQAVQESSGNRFEGTSQMYYFFSGWSTWLPSAPLGRLWWKLYYSCASIFFFSPMEGCVHRTMNPPFFASSSRIRITNTICLINLTISSHWMDYVTFYIENKFPFF